MSADQIAIWVEIFASVAVLITLVFLNVQIRQTNALMRSESRQAQVVIDQEHISKFIEHPELAAAYGSDDHIDTTTRRDYGSGWCCHFALGNTSGFNTNTVRSMTSHGSRTRESYRLP